MNRILISVIIPVFRGGNILPELYKRIHESLDMNYSFEVLFICDGCDRLSKEAVEKIREEYPDHVRCFRFLHNYGQHRAIQFGFGKANGDFVITLDEDLQHDPGDIRKLLNKQAENDYDVVYGKFINHQHRGMRNVMSGILRKVLKHFIPSLYDNYSPYRLIKRDTAVNASVMTCPYTFIDDFLSRITQNIAFVEVTHYKRLKGKSSYTFGKLLLHGIYILLAYSAIIYWFLAIACVTLFTGALILGIRLLTSDIGWKNQLNSKLIMGIFVLGSILIIISLFGTYINQRNTFRNTRSVRLKDENTI
jgi:polyisoprenyl-phosphate glycosyltransferase